jgi:hypothetical protein
MEGFKSTGFLQGAKGIDDLVEDADGNLVIVEAKGGPSGLVRFSFLGLSSDVDASRFCRSWAESFCRPFRG